MTSQQEFLRRSEGNKKESDVERSHPRPHKNTYRRRLADAACRERGREAGPAIIKARSRSGQCMGLDDLIVRQKQKMVSHCSNREYENRV